jgi:pyruvate formate lyase activating enzyme
MSSHRALVADVVPSSCVDGPGNRFVVFVQGCNFDCIACHNPHTIPLQPGSGSRWVVAGDLLEPIREAAPLLSGVTVSGGEATVQWKFVAELFGALAADPSLAGLTRFVDTNGDAAPLVWDALAPVMDAAMVDLKAVDADVHRFLTGRSNERVLESIEQLAGLGKLHEVRLLLVPGVNDRPDQLMRTAERLTALAPGIPIRLLGFRRYGTRDIAHGFREPGPTDLERAAGHLTDHGVDPRCISVTGNPPSELARGR